MGPGLLLLLHQLVAFCFSMLATKFRHDLDSMQSAMQGAIFRTAVLDTVPRNSHFMQVPSNYIMYQKILNLLVLSIYF
jgi:hypothetical protein